MWERRETFIKAEWFAAFVKGDILYIAEGGYFHSAQKL